MHVEEAMQADPELLGALASLVPQLSSSSPAPAAEQIAAIVESSATRLLVARDAADAIVGILTLVVFTIPTGVRAIIEDVVVDNGARGQGVGAALVEAALATAASAGARTVDLTLATRSARTPIASTCAWGSSAGAPTSTVGRTRAERCLRGRPTGLTSCPLHGPAPRGGRSHCRVRTP